MRLMLEFTVVGENVRTPKALKPTGKLQRFRHFFKCQAPDVAKLISTGRATVVHP